MWSECLLELSLGFAENVLEKRKKKRTSSEQRQQLRGGKRLVDDRGQRSDWAETGLFGNHREAVSRVSAYQLVNNMQAFVIKWPASGRTATP